MAEAPLPPRWDWHGWCGRRPGPSALGSGPPAGKMPQLWQPGRLLPLDGPFYHDSPCLQMCLFSLHRGSTMSCRKQLPEGWGWGRGRGLFPLTDAEQNTCVLMVMVLPGRNRSKTYFCKCTSLFLIFELLLQKFTKKEFLVNCCCKNLQKKNF